LGIEIDPIAVSRARRQALRAEVQTLAAPPRLVGLLATDARPSRVYARYTARAAAEVGVDFQLRRVDRYELEAAIDEANADPSVHGIMVYYPVFGVVHDNYLKDQVAPHKDVEGLHSRWAHELYRGEGPASASRDGAAPGASGSSPLLPCTPLAILALLDAAGVPRVEGDRARTAVVFNRSEVVGRPLAAMMAREGARVLSFDEDGVVEVTGTERGTRWRDASVTRAEALAEADVLVTGVPSQDFPLIRAEEIRADVAAVNFSTLRNFTPEAAAKARVWVPRVGPMTVTMALSNLVRLYRAHEARGER